MKGKLRKLSIALFCAALMSVTAFASDPPANPTMIPITDVTNGMVGAYTNGINGVIDAIGQIIPVAAALIAVALLIRWVPRIVNRLK